MRTKTAILFCFCLAVIMAAGCAPTRLETDYGTSFQLQKYNQALNPEAEKNLEPVEGIGGHPAQKAVEKYEKSFEKAPPKGDVFQFSIGSQGGN